jgi:hypothetical protein
MDDQFLDDLAIYDGPYIQPVRENPARFTRDGMKLHKFLARRAADCTAAPMRTCGTAQAPSEKPAVPTH